MQVIGLCRFSYPAIGGFQVDHPTLEERIAYLYSPARMEERFATFETITLPPLRAQTDPDFTFLVVIGDSLPDHYRQRLDALLADVPQAIVAAYPPKRHRKIMQDAINEVRAFDGEHCLQFRMDDDDAVGVRYVERLREDETALYHGRAGADVQTQDRAKRDELCPRQGGAEHAHGHHHQRRYGAARAQ